MYTKMLVHEKSVNEEQTGLYYVFIHRNFSFPTTAEENL